MYSNAMLSLERVNHRLQILSKQDTLLALPPEKELLVEGKYITLQLSNTRQLLESSSPKLFFFFYSKQMNAVSSQSTNGLLPPPHCSPPLKSGARTPADFRSSFTLSLHRREGDSFARTNAVRHNWMWPGAKQLPAATLDCSCHQVAPGAGKYIPVDASPPRSYTVIAYLPLLGDHSFVVNNCQYHTAEWVWTLEPLNYQ